jgi:hypothetical protein
MRQNGGHCRFPEYPIAALRSNPKLANLLRQTLLSGRDFSRHSLKHPLKFIPALCGFNAGMKSLLRYASKEQWFDGIFHSEFLGAFQGRNSRYAGYPCRFFVTRLCCMP